VIILRNKKLVEVFIIFMLGFIVNATAKPLKVYILAGQSNMEGHAKIETFDYMGDDPATKPLLKAMRGLDGKPRICDKVWISYYTGRKDSNGEGFGKLTAGYGSRSNPVESGGKIGPEFTFGITMEKASKEPILIIKTAWGGKSIHTDYRSPSGGAYEFNVTELANFKKQGKDIEKIKADKKKATGHYYRLMLAHVKKILADIKRVYPNYDAKQGYELAGFVWFQGFNDMVAGNTYPERKNPGGYDLYSKLLAHFIRDVRKDLSRPKMPFVIGVMGVGGLRDKPDYFRQAMAAPAALPEFKGNVIAVETAPFWDQPLADLEKEISMVNKAAYYLKKKQPFHIRKNPKGAAILDKYLGKDETTMTKKQINAFMKEYRAKMISPEKQAMWKRGASNAGYHYLGCAKTMGLIGQAFANAILKMENK
jgi:hypothetical protein